MQSDAQRSYRVEPGNAGRADTWLAAAVDVSRGYAQRLLARGIASVDGRRLAKGSALRSGDCVRIAPFRHPAQGLLADPDAPLRIAAEASGFIAIDKPAGQPCHPLDYDECGSALQALIARRPAVAGAYSRSDPHASPLEGGCLHRLDVETSGLLVFATDAESWQRGREAFADQRVDKRYLARVAGELHGARDLELRLVDRGARVAVVDGGGRPARMRVESLESTPESSLVRVYLYTGVRHQIRASLAWLGHPVLGDAVYGRRGEFDRHLLHAEYLALGSDFEAHAAAPICVVQRPRTGGSAGR